MGILRCLDDRCCSIVSRYLKRCIVLAVFIQAYGFPIGGIFPCIGQLGFRLCHSILCKRCIRTAGITNLIKSAKRHGTVPSLYIATSKILILSPRDSFSIILPEALRHRFVVFIHPHTGTAVSKDNQIFISTIYLFVSIQKILSLLYTCLKVAAATSIHTTVCFVTNLIRKLN